MFQNRITSFVVPSFGTSHPMMPSTAGGLADTAQRSLPLVVPLANIYEAARQKAIEDHEIDKLFNPDYFDYQI